MPGKLARHWGMIIFVRKLKSKLGCKAGQSRRGRPKMKPNEERIFFKEL
jgi:hypothetical protein